RLRHRARPGGPARGRCGGGGGVTRKIGAFMIGFAVVAALAAPIYAPYDESDRFPGLLNAPPTVPRVIDDAGAWHAPFIYPWRVVNQLEQTYVQDRSTRVPLAWFVGGHLVSSS